MSNSARKRATFQSIIGCSEFRAGWDDFRAGRQMRDDWRGRDRAFVAAQQWSYERGRMFAAWCKAEGLDMVQLKAGRRVTDAAVFAFADAYRQKAIL